MSKILVNKNGQALMSPDGKVYKGAVEQVIPEGYIKPSGSLAITENGTHNVREYEIVEVSVGGVTTEMVFDVVDNEEIETILPLTKSYYTGGFKGFAEIVKEGTL